MRRWQTEWRNFELSPPQSPAARRHPLRRRRNRKANRIANRDCSVHWKNAWKSVLFRETTTDRFGADDVRALMRKKTLLTTPSTASLGLFPVARPASRPSHRAPAPRTGSDAATPPSRAARPPRGPAAPRLQAPRLQALSVWLEGWTWA